VRVIGMESGLERVVLDWADRGDIAGKRHLRAVEIRCCRKIAVVIEAKGTALTRE
jgi:hypothetical protein